jgi:cytochrome P450
MARFPRSPDHTRLRALLQKTFTPRQLANSRPRIQAAIDALIDGALAKGGDTTSSRSSPFRCPRS